MRASKEQCKCAITAVREAQEKVKGENNLDLVLTFLESAYRKLPTEAAYNRDSQRRRQRLTA